MSEHCDSFSNYALYDYVKILWSTGIQGLKLASFHNTPFKSWNTAQMYELSKLYLIKVWQPCISKLFWLLITSIISSVIKYIQFRTLREITSYSNISKQWWQNSKLNWIWMTQHCKIMLQVMCRWYIKTSTCLDCLYITEDLICITKVESIMLHCQQILAH